MPRVVYAYRWQKPQALLQVYTDSDWAGCVRTRRSTSGGVVMHGSHCIHHWSRTQLNVALSSGEAELNAMLKGGCEGLGLKTMLGEAEAKVDIQLYGDSSAARGTVARQGIGKTKHLDVKQLWMQEKVAEGVIKSTKIPRDANISDALTHAWTTADMHHFKGMCLRG